MKLLSVAGLIAMFLVGGGILVHGIPWIEHWVAGFAESGSSVMATLARFLTAALVGVLAGAITVAVVGLARKVMSGRRPAADADRPAT
jgi:predicted DNA repair protein MutK